jgi:hypothetical protein
MHAAEKLNITIEEFMQMPKDEHKNYELIEAVKDLNGNDRVVICRFLQK